MKWFIVMMALVNGQPVVWVEDNQPYDTRLRVSAREHRRPGEWPE
jgi:hypothetical protein